jgi:hypothetical protein
MSKVQKTLQEGDNVFDAYNFLDEIIWRGGYTQPD